MAQFSLDGLRGSFTRQFAEWDRCVGDANTQGAKAVRRDIKQFASLSLEIPEARCAGFYVFLDRRTPGMAQVRYIGIARTARRPIAARIVDRLRDDSGLDTALDDLDDDGFREVVTRRLLVALPTSGMNYVEKALSVAKLFRSSSNAAIVPCSAGGEAIAAAERALIGSAAAAGAPLFNNHHRTYRGPITGTTYDLAKMAIGVCEAEGLDRSGGDSWRSALDKLR